MIYTKYLEVQDIKFHLINIYSNYLNSKIIDKFFLNFFIMIIENIFSNKITALINFTNFMDGIDGLVGGMH